MNHSYLNLKMILDHPDNPPEFKLAESRKWLVHSKIELKQLFSKERQSLKRIKTSTI
jgi:hypothetical protein